MTSGSTVTKTPHQGYEGSTFGGFRLIREIASGGMATVYLGQKGEYPGVSQFAAIKVIHPHLARDPDFVDMFLDEARIVSCISHPNVCRILDFGISEGTYFLAMEYVMGETWAEIMARMSASPMAESAIAPVLALVLAQACEGLHAAHEARDNRGKPLRIVHRDVSPYNIMVGYDGSVRVVDFGIASATERLHITRNGAVKGRLSYMAPEQMRGTAIDRRADVWSLGVVLWEGLAQRRLFRRSNEAKTVLAVTHDPLPSLADCGYPVPAPLQKIATRALQRECGARYASARDLGVELSRCATTTLAPFGIPELSGWMHRLFPQEIEAKRALADGAGNEREPRPSSGVSNLATDSSAADGQRTRPIKRGARLTAPVSAVRPIPLGKAPRTGKRFASTTVLLIAGMLTLVGTRRAGEYHSESAADEGSRRKETIVEPALAEAVAETSEGDQELAPKADLKAAEDDEHAQKIESDPDITFDLGEIERLQALSANTTSRAPQSIKVGTVSVATPGVWADIYLGTRKLGTTPARLSVPAGIHTLRLRRFGTGPDVVRRVIVEPGAAVRLKVAME